MNMKIVQKILFGEINKMKTYNIVKLMAQEGIQRAIKR